MSASIALLVGITKYEDQHLRELEAPQHDLDVLARVLGDPLIGGYEVLPPLLDEPMQVVQEEIGNLFADRSPDDRLLLYFSGHGLKSDAGELYLATTNTKVRTTTATAVPSSFIRGEIERSRSRSVILLLDCCYGGAFTRGDLVPRAGEQVDVLDRFAGRGRAVITASTAMQWAFELDHDRRLGTGRPSVFTGVLVRGLETGEADRDRDGWISVEELYDYLHDEVRRQVPEQTPTASIKVEGKLYVARNRRRQPTSQGPLPAAVSEDLGSPLSGVREAAVRDLAALLGREPDVAAAARRALEELEEDDSKRVSTAAAEALKRHGIATRSPTTASGNRFQGPPDASGGAAAPTTSSANQSPAGGSTLGASRRGATGARPSGSASPRPSLEPRRTTAPSPPPPWSTYLAEGSHRASTSRAAPGMFGIPGDIRRNDRSIDLSGWPPWVVISAVVAVSLAVLGAAIWAFVAFQPLKDMGWSRVNVLLIGLVVGVVAKALLPGDDPGGIILTIAIGVAGALVGVFVAKGVFGANISKGLLDLRIWLTALAGSIVLLLLYRVVVLRGRGRRRVI